MAKNLVITRRQDVRPSVTVHTFVLALAEGSTLLVLKKAYDDVETSTFN